MKQWFRKIFVILITILTLGLYIPPIYINTNAEENKDAVSSKANVHEDALNSVTTIEKSAHPESTNNYVEDSFNDKYFINDLTQKAKEQALTKLGPRIFEQVEDEFMEYILPTIEDVLQTVLLETEEDDLPFYNITEQPTSGFGERIFHVYDNRTKKDIIRFHVRRDNRPLEGYWFNFHYHLRDDNFEKHHDIGEIYWDKNVPPKWMT